ncbi:MAG: right-handed parallel beta-helix repeat-containing protein [Saprospiraceae bacterium]|nr:right-handed parallel beta-helix repeat-containing protein [Saprospiraceae bacterium]
MSKYIFSLCLSFLIFDFLNAKTWYVATTGNDNSAGTLSAPFKTIPKAISSAAAGDIIELRGGTYSSNEIRITKSNLTLRSYTGEWAIINAVMNDEDIASCIWYNEPDVVGGTLENLEITGGYYYGVSFETNWDWGVPLNQRHGVSNITIRNCKIHDTGRDCIKIKPFCNNIKILNCSIYNSGKGPGNNPNDPNAEGIDNVNGWGMEVKGCYIHHTSTTGIYAKGGAKNCIIEENLIMETGEAGILLGFYTDADFFDTTTNPSYYECINSIARNNMVVNTGGAGIGFFAAQNCEAYNNTVVTATPKFHAPLFCAKGEVWISNSLTLTPANQSIKVYNNIFIDKSGTGDEDFTAQLREGALTGTNVFANNIYHKTTGAAKFNDGVSYPYPNFAEWKTRTQLDLTSREGNPNLNTQFHLVAGSIAIDAGRSIPSNSRDYDGNLRTGSPDIGADELNAGASLQVPPPSNVIGTGTAIVSKIKESKIEDKPIFVFPNPIYDMAHLKGDTTSFDIYEVFDVSGRLCLKNNMTSSTINLTSLQQGYYFLKLSSKNGEFKIVTFNKL